MIKYWPFLLLALLFLPAPPARGETSSQSDVLKRIMDRVKENDQLTEDYGYYYEAKTRELDSDDKVTKEESRLYRIIWVENKPFFEILKVDGHELTSKDKAEETERKKKFIKSVHDNKPTEFKMNWDELFAKFDYTIASADGDARYVVSFQPKKIDLPERSRMEKVFNNIGGKVWVDADYNVTKANLWLIGNVKFGLGIIASLDELELQYSQQKYDNLWFPASMRLKYDLRIFLKGKHQQWESRFYDMYARPKD